MVLKYPLLVCSFFLLGNAKADMVGIRPTNTPGETFAVGQNFTFSTTGLSGSKISGIGLYRIGGTESKSLTVSLAGNNSFETKTGSFSVAASSGGDENSITWDRRGLWPSCLHKLYPYCGFCQLRFSGW